MFPTAADYRSMWLAYIYYLRRQLDTISTKDELWESSVQEIRDVVVMAYQNLTECSYRDVLNILRALLLVFFDYRIVRSSRRFWKRR